MTAGNDMPTAPAANPQRLQVTEERLGGGIVRLRLAGELDPVTGEHLRAAARAGRFGFCACFEIDLGSLSYVDAGGMAALADAVHAIEDVGGCVVVAAGDAAQRIAQAAGVSREVVFA